MSSNGFGSDSNEHEIESDFITRLAQVELGADDLKGFDETLKEAADPAPADEAQDPATDGLPNLDTDMEEMSAIKDLIPWDSFAIIFDPHYSKLLEETLGLPPTKAKAKSYYVYFSPENKRLEGVVNKRYIGGYGTKEELGDDFSFLKTLSPEGFAPDWKEKLLTDIDELPAVENSIVRDSLREKAEEKDELEEAPVEEEQEKIEVPEENQKGQQEAPPNDNTVDFQKPQPVGKVDTNALPAAASIKDKTMRRMARIKAFKSR